MKRIAYLSILLLCALVVLFVSTARAQEDQGVEPVSAYDDYFDPADIAVPSGTTVLWTNEGEKPHTVTAHDGSFASPILYPGESYQVTFYEPGTYTYQ
jgi:plastocyanin